MKGFLRFFPLLLLVLCMVGCQSGDQTTTDSPEAPSTQQPESPESSEPSKIPPSEPSSSVSTEPWEEVTEITGPTDPDWGSGILVPTEMDYIPSEVLIFPDERVTLLDAPNGKAVGTLEKSGDYSLYYNSPEGEEEFSYSAHCLKEVSYEGKALLFHQLQAEHVSVIPMEGGEEYWISLGDLLDQQFTYLTWADFLLFQYTTYFPVPEGGLNLRDQPQADATKLTTMQGDTYGIQLTGVQKGLWLEAKVEHWREHPCVGDDTTLESWTGWLKALDDKGFPNIWFYTRGC